jgi:hypothetical protein
MKSIETYRREINEYFSAAGARKRKAAGLTYRQDMESRWPELFEGPDDSSGPLDQVYFAIMAGFQRLDADRKKRWAAKVQAIMDDFQAGTVQ